MDMNFDLDTKVGMERSVKWQTNMVGLLGEGGSWGIPDSQSIYKVYPSKKRAVSKNGDTQINRVFKEMGWTVEIEA